MKKWIPLLAAYCMICCLVACQSKTHDAPLTDEEKIAVVVEGEDALSAEELKRQHEARAAILNNVHAGNAAEEELRQALEDARNFLDAADAARLEAAQNDWLKQGRGKAINALIQQGWHVQEAYAKVSTERAQKIREQLNRAVLIAAPKKYQGYFRASSGQSLEIYQLDEEVLVVTMRTSDPPIVVNAKGQFTLGASSVSLVSEKDATIAFELRWVDNAHLELTPHASATQSPAFSPFATMLTARYQRIQKDEIDVFSF